MEDKIYHSPLQTLRGRRFAWNYERVAPPEKDLRSTANSSLEPTLTGMLAMAFASAASAPCTVRVLDTTVLH